MRICVLKIQQFLNLNFIFFKMDCKAKEEIKDIENWGKTITWSEIKNIHYISFDASVADCEEAIYFIYDEII